MTLIGYEGAACNKDMADSTCKSQYLNLYKTASWKLFVDSWLMTVSLHSWPVVEEWRIQSTFLMWYDCREPFILGKS